MASHIYFSVQFCIIRVVQTCSYTEYTGRTKNLWKGRCQAHESDQETVPLAEDHRDHHQKICRKFGCIGTDFEADQITAAQKVQLPPLPGYPEADCKCFCTTAERAADHIQRSGSSLSGSLPVDHATGFPRGPVFLLCFFLNFCCSYES